MYEKAISLITVDFHQYMKERMEVNCLADNTVYFTKENRKTKLKGVIYFFFQLEKPISLLVDSTRIESFVPIYAGMPKDRLENITINLMDYTCVKLSRQRLCQSDEQTNSKYIAMPCWTYLGASPSSVTPFLNTLRPVLMCHIRQTGGRQPLVEQPGARYNSTNSEIIVLTFWTIFVPLLLVLLSTNFWQWLNNLSRCISVGCGMLKR